MTQAQLAEQLSVSDKTISKWETCKGLPDISLLEPLAKALRVSVPELLSGEQIVNRNQSANLKRASLYVCPVCGNILCSSGNALISCCGIVLPPLETEKGDWRGNIIIGLSVTRRSMTMAPCSSAPTAAARPFL